MLFKQEEKREDWKIFVLVTDNVDTFYYDDNRSVLLNYVVVVVIMVDIVGVRVVVVVGYIYQIAAAIDI